LKDLDLNGAIYKSSEPEQICFANGK